MNKKIAALIAIFVLLLSGCFNSDAKSLNGKPLEEIKKDAVGEGVICSLGMPDDWLNWGLMWDTITTRYGLYHDDIDMSSAETVSYLTVDSVNASRDIGDVGVEYAMEAERLGLTLKYKTDYWDDIPINAKDDDGDWIVCYTGTISFLIDNSIVKKPPQTWSDLLEGDYTIALGDVFSSKQAQMGFLASSIALGGSTEDFSKANKLWTTLIDEGRIAEIDLTSKTVADQKAGVYILWDFNAINYARTIKANDSSADLSYHIPLDGSVTSGYAPIINRYAANENAAALVRSYILSDEGQTIIAEAGARPIRDIGLSGKSELIDESEYENAVFLVGINASDTDRIADNWDNNIQ